MRFGAKENQVVGEEGYGDVGKHHRMRAVGDLLIRHMLVVNIASVLPQPPLGRFQVQPSLHRLGFVIGIAVRIDVPLPQYIIERMRRAFGQPVA